MSSREDRSTTGNGWSVAEWVLLRANRAVVAAVLTGACFALLTTLGTLDLPFRSVFSSGDTIETLFQTLIGVLITGTTLVVSINQIVLSQEFGSLGKHRERMDKSMSFREESEREFRWTGPPEPDRFLETLIETSADRATALRETVEGNADGTLGERVDQFVERTIASAEGTTDELADARFGEFTVLRAALAYNYSWKIYMARRIFREHEDSLSEDERDAFEEVIEVLALFGPAEEFFKAHYIQWELVDLSRRILYTGIPALLVSIIGALYLKPDIVSGSAFGVPLLVWLVDIGVTVAVIPFFVFSAYVLRTASIAKRSGAIGPFVLHDSERAPLIEWGE